MKRSFAVAVPVLAALGAVALSGCRSTSPSQGLKMEHGALSIVRAHYKPSAKFEAIEPKLQSGAAWQVTEDPSCLQSKKFCSLFKVTFRQQPGTNAGKGVDAEWMVDTASLNCRALNSDAQEMFVEVH